MHFEVSEIVPEVVHITGLSDEVSSFHMGPW